MVSWSDSGSSSDAELVSSKAQLPATILCLEWSGLATDLSSRCEHACVCEKLVAFDSVDSGRRFLACAQKSNAYITVVLTFRFSVYVAVYASLTNFAQKIPKCSYLEWVDPEWPAPLKMSLARIWGMYEDENKLRLQDNVVHAEENLRVVREKEKMEKDLRFFKVNFAQMVAEKEQALAQLGNTQLALADMKEDLDKKKMSDKSFTNIHQVVRAKAEKERDLMKQERDNIMEERDSLVQERDNLVLERNVLKQEKKKLEYMIGDLFKHKEDTKGKIRNLKEMLEELE
nr:uncharacterized protein LOC109751585 [Aegilops tauschii subsp. strangulata]